MKRHSVFPVVYGIVLTAFTAYIALDTFVLADRYQTDATQMNTSMFESSYSAGEAAEEKAGTSAESVPEAAGESVRRGKRANEEEESSESAAGSSQSITDTSYQDDNIQITLTEYYENDTKIYVADVWVASAEYLKTAFAEDTYGRNVTAKTSAIASAHGAIFAVNGDYYGAQERGYVIRNGVVYRSTRGSNDVLCIYADGTMRVVSPDEYTAEELADQGVWQAFSFGPGLVENGQIAVSEGEEVGKAMASNPRTAVGMIEPGHYVFVVSDGRTDESEGLSLYQLVQFMQGLGVTTAYNLDGGGSSTMYFNGSVINNPTTSGRIKERGVSDIVYIG